ncbi:MAG: amidoligase family protein [bacterium]
MKNNNTIDEIDFGVEFEFTKTDLNTIKNEIQNSDQLYNRNMEWNVVTEGSCENYDFTNNTILGGEVVSPILNSSNKKDLTMIKNILNLLNENNVGVDDRTAMHIHYDAQQSMMNTKYIELVELWLAFEPIIFRFGFNKDINGRLLIEDYAAPLRADNYNYLIFLDFCKRKNYKLEDYHKVFGNNYSRFDKSKCLNFSNMIHNYESKKMVKVNTVEVRTPDSTTDYDSALANIMFFKNIFKLATTDIDLDYLRSINRRTPDENSFESLMENYKQINNPLFEELIGMMDIDSSTEEMFIRQYQK